MFLLWLLFITGRSIWRSRAASVQGSAEWIYFGAIEMMALAICVSTASSGNLMDNDFWMFMALTAVSARVAVARRERVEPAHHDVGGVAARRQRARRLQIPRPRRVAQREPAW